MIFVAIPVHELKLVFEPLQLCVVHAAACIAHGFVSFPGICFEFVLDDAGAVEAQVCFIGGACDLQNWLFPVDAIGGSGVEDAAGVCIPHAERAGFFIAQDGAVDVDALVENAVFGPHLPGHVCGEDGVLQLPGRMDDAGVALLAADHDAVHEELLFAFFQQRWRRAF